MKLKSQTHYTWGTKYVFLPCLWKNLLGGISLPSELTVGVDIAEQRGACGNQCSLCHAALNDQLLCPSAPEQEWLNNLLPSSLPVFPTPPHQRLLSSDQFPIHTALHSDSCLQWQAPLCLWLFLGHSLLSSPLFQTLPFFGTLSALVQTPIPCFTSPNLLCNTQKCWRVMLHNISQIK